IRRQRRAAARRRGGAPAPSPRPLARPAAPRRRPPQDHRAAAAAHAADVAILRVCRRRRRPVRRAGAAGVRRVYQAATAAPAPGGWGIALDQRPLRTPGGNPLTLPSAQLAQAIAEEWEAQERDIRPATMPLFRLAATAVDRTAVQRDLVVAETANYAATDLVCYRADQPPALAARQRAAWQPLLDWAAGRCDAALCVTSGIVPAR